MRVLASLLLVSLAACSSSSSTKGTTGASDAGASSGTLGASCTCNVAQGFCNGTGASAGCNAGLTCFGLAGKPSPNPPVCTTLCALPDGGADDSACSTGYICDQLYYSAASPPYSQFYCLPQ